MKIPSTLPLLAYAASLVSAQDYSSLENFQDVDCTGMSTTCSHVPPLFCCAALWTITSVKAYALKPYGIASIFEDGNNKACGDVNNSGFGLSACVNAKPRFAACAGSMWHDVPCSSKRATCKREDEFAAFWAKSKEERDASVNEQECKGRVQPDKLTLKDGHIFEIGSEAVKEDVDAFVELALKTPGMTIEHVPEHLLKLKVGFAKRDE